MDSAQGASPPRRSHHPSARARALLDRAFERTRLRRSNAPAPTPTPGPPTAFLAGTANQTTESSTPAEIPLEPPQDPVGRAAEVRVAVVIAMPDPRRSAYVPPAVDAEMHQLTPGGKGKGRGMCDGWGDEGDEEAGVPDIIFGTAKVPVAAPATVGADGEGGEP